MARSEKLEAAVDEANRKARPDTAREVQIGIRFTLAPPAVGPHHFGAEEVNALIAKGWRVALIAPAGIAFHETGDKDEMEETVALVLKGWDMSVTLEPPPAAKGWRHWFGREDKR